MTPAGQEIYLGLVRVAYASSHRAERAAGAHCDFVSSDGTSKVEGWKHIPATFAHVQRQRQGARRAMAAVSEMGRE